MPTTDLGTAITVARERKRMTQQQLAEAVGVELRTVGGWERGESKPRNRMAALEEVLGVSLRPGTVGPVGEPPPMLDLPADALDGLDAREQAEVRAAAQAAALERAREIRRR